MQSHSVPTAKSWLSILQASYLVHLLQPFHSNITKRLVKTPKLYFLDTGLCAYLTDWTTPEALAAGAMSGAILETWVVGEILKSWWFHMDSPALYFYRDKDKKEIDLLLVCDQRLHPVEVKRAASVRKVWARHFPLLERFLSGRGAGVVVCLTDMVVPIDDKTTAIPIWLL